MTSHELAKKLLAGPDLPVVTSYISDSLFIVRDVKTVRAIDSCHVGEYAKAKPEDTGEMFYPVFEKKKCDKELNVVRVG